MEFASAAVVDKVAALQLFKKAALTRSLLGVTNENGWALGNVADDAGINLFQFSRDSDFHQIWVTFLSVMKDVIAEGEHKYTSLEAFLEAYTEFASYSPEEQTNLWATANWMAILFTMIPAAKNKGLVMQVIPQLVEGPQAKYITGSGQTDATANRVHIYEREGAIKVAHRSSKARATVKKRSSKSTGVNIISAAKMAAPRAPKSNAEGLELLLAALPERLVKPAKNKCYDYDDASHHKPSSLSSPPETALEHHEHHDQNSPSLPISRNTSTLPLHRPRRDGSNEDQDVDIRVQLGDTATYLDLHVNSNSNIASIKQQIAERSFQALPADRQLLTSGYGSTTDIIGLHAVAGCRLKQGSDDHLLHQFNMINYECFKVVLEPEATSPKSEDALSDSASSPDDLTESSSSTSSPPSLDGDSHHSKRPRLDLDLMSTLSSSAVSRRADADSDCWTL